MKFKKALKRIGNLVVLAGSVAIVLAFAYELAQAIGINYIYGSNVTVGKGLSMQATDGVDSIWVGDDSLVVAMFGDEDWGDMSVASNLVTIDEDVIDKVFAERAVYVISSVAGYCPDFLLEQYDFAKADVLHRVVSRRQRN